MSSTPAPSRGHHIRLGSFGEQYAARYLTVEKGMALLDRNWRGPAGEIDLVLRDGRTLVVCEVKTRSSERFGSALEAVDEAKGRRLRVLAHQWCEARGIAPSDLRIDLVGVLVRGAAVVRVDHAVAVG